MRIGIITLHRVLNYGSALQAYALQEYIRKHISKEVEIIDYIYPNQDHKKDVVLSVGSHIKGIIRRAIKENILEKRLKTKKCFSDFYNRYYVLSNDSFNSIREIEKTKPKYDLYITGSDQVWNVKTLFNDPVYYCSFAPTGTRLISFGASFSIKKLPDEYHNSIKERLNKYSCIGIRELSGLDIIKDLDINSSIPVKYTCDPTLLLDCEDYNLLAEKSSIRIEGEYILVYKLDYAFDVKPAIDIAIDEARKRFGYKVVMIGDIKTRLKKGDQRVSGFGPCEFLWLFKNAKVVITSSFHGTMFSLIYSKPFVSIAPPRSYSENRIAEFLQSLGMECNIVYNDDEFSSPINICWEKLDHQGNRNNLSAFIKESKAFLEYACFNKELK